MKHEQYYALKASLPMLLFDGACPITEERFFECCASFLPEESLDFLRSLDLCPVAEPHFPGSSSMDRFARWEITLRNTLAVLRGAKLSLDASPYLVEQEDEEFEALTAAKRIFSLQADPLERDRALDRARWDFLESMELDHTFDFDALCIYCCKMQIRNKWASRQKDKALANLEKAADLSEKASENIKISES